MAKEFTSEGLIETLKHYGIRDENTLHPKGNLGGQVIRKAIQGSGARLKQIVVYRLPKAPKPPFP